MDLPRLRKLLRPQVENLKDHGTHERLPAICEVLGLPRPELDGSKRERMLASFDALTDDSLPEVALRFLTQFPPVPSIRNELQDVLWADEPGPPIPKRFRRELARGLGNDLLYRDAEKFDALVESLFEIEDDPFCDPFTPHRTTLRALIRRHVYRNPGDWSVEELFARIGAYDCSDRRFCLLLEGMAGGAVRPDVADQRLFVERVNELLRPCTVELRETGSEGGYPVFSVASRGSAPGRPKNIIFASSVKPDLRFRDAVNNDIEIVSNADEVLVYDESIMGEGLRWHDLQRWWARREQIDDEEEAKATLYRRLRRSLPTNSPPQRWFFESYFRAFGLAVHKLPALLPEVWLHWDPRTVAERGADALARFRMDFLLLLPHGTRVVVEVDGKHHFAENDGLASPGKYSEMVAADRDLRLAGYEVYRFGATELVSRETSDGLVKEFFTRLFGRHGLTTS